MKKISNQIILCVLPLLLCCEKSIEMNEVLSDMTFDKHEFLADGKSTITIKVRLPNNASADRKSITFSTSAGTFNVSKSDKQNVTPEFENGILIATAKLQAPFKPGAIIITTQPAFDSPVKEYVLSDSVTALPSKPTHLTLGSTSFGLGANAITEVTLSALLTNTNGGNVSEGYSVLFEDFLSDGQSAGGRFQRTKGATTDSSKVTSVYGAANLPIGTLIRIKATHFEQTGTKSSIQDTILLSINQ